MANKAKTFTCNNCLHEWLKNPPTTDYEIQVNRNADMNQLEEKTNKRIEHLLNNIAGEISVLEIGCAEGLFLEKLSRVKRIKRLAGIEPSLDSSIAHDKGIEIYKSFGSLLNDTIKPRFDVACLFHVLEHIEDPLSFIISIIQLLQEKSFIFIEVPNQSGHPMIREDPNPEHIQRFSPASIAVLLERAGFALLQLSSGHRESVVYPDSIRVIAARKCPLKDLGHALQQILSNCDYIWGIGGDFRGYIAAEIADYRRHKFIDVNAEDIAMNGFAGRIDSPKSLMHNSQTSKSNLLVSTIRHEASIKEYMMIHGIEFHHITYLSDLMRLK